MTSSRPNTNYDFDNLDWADYEVHRPRYTPDMYKLIYDYQSKHGAKDPQKALDVGGGIGIVTKELLKRFPAVTLSDPSHKYVSEAKKAFEPFAAANPGRVTFLEGKLEELTPEKLPNGQVDLITAGECLHWADVAKCPSVANSLLAPNGTLAMWIYGIRVNFPEKYTNGEDSTTTKQIYETLYDRYIDLYQEKIEKLTDDNYAAVMNARFDCYEFAPEQWDHVTRVYDRKNTAFCSQKTPTAKSKIQSHETIIDLEKEEALLSQIAGYDWMYGYMVNLIPPLELEVNLKDDFQQLKDAMAGREVKLEWGYSLILATKKG